MKKAAILTIPVLMLAMASFSQTILSGGGMKKSKVFTHQVGVQMNELIRQVFNFSNNTGGNAVTNPYLLIYSINLKKSGWGLRIGAGYNFRSFTDDDGVTFRETEVTDISGRLGIEKAFFLSGKWSTGIGIDGVFNTNENYTSALVRGFDTVTTNINSKVQSYGGGAQGWLRYHITDRVLIGTEASFYYRTGDQNQDIEITRRDQTLPSMPYRTSVSSIDNKTSEGAFSLPVVFYLMIRF